MTGAALDGIQGRARVQIDAVSPVVDNGRFAAKRCIDEDVEVTAVAYADGHERLGCALLHRPHGQAGWHEVPMEPLGNDRWKASFRPSPLGVHEYTIEAWIDSFGSWRDDLARRADPHEIIELELEVGARLLRECAVRADEADATLLANTAGRLVAAEPLAGRVALALAPETATLAARHPDRSHATRFKPALRLIAEPPHARCSAWYEFFPRSTGENGSHGTFATATRMLEYVAGLGFDVVYLPPIHPIGEVHRKGKNNIHNAAPGDVGSPWAIGSALGGHCDVHPALGTLGEFDEFVATAKRLGLKVALDIAFQCAPDHPLVATHPEWFRRRPDGSIRYAENPPKRYEDIVPFDFSCDDWPGLWNELLSVILFWVERGVRILRVDNPHTKAMPFWEWCIAAVKEHYPDAIFLAEAFTRPALLEGLARRGFSQSYTYFAWRNTRWELEQYFTELTQTPVREFLRPNLWPNTPDILTEYLQTGGRNAFMARFVLAATLGASYGIYGPAYELCESEPLAPGSEEYLNSEKYQLRSWDLDAPWSLRDLITRVNAIRRAHPALQQDHTLRFHGCDNEQLICYSKVSSDRTDVVLCVVNLDPHYRQTGHVALDLEALGIDPEHPYQVHDLLGDGRYLWIGPHNYVELDPGASHIFVPRRHLRSERDFDYFL